MVGSKNANANPPLIVILTGDYGLSARLQRSFQKLHWQSIGFYFVEDAIEWEELQTDTEKLFIIDHDINGISWKEALRAFHRNDLAIDALVLINPDQGVTAREVKQHGAIGAVVRNDQVFDILPDKLDDIFCEIRFEYEQPAEIYQDHLLRYKNSAKCDDKQQHDIIERISINQKHEYKDGSFDVHKKQLEQLRIELSEQNKREKAYLLRHVGLELREDAGTMINIARSLESSTSDKKQKNLLGSLINTAGELVISVNNMIDHEKILSENEEVIYQNFHLKAMLHDVIESTKTRAEKNSKRLEVKIYDNVPGYIFADKIKIQQVLVNLLRWLIKNMRNAVIGFSVQMLSDRMGSERLIFNIGKYGLDACAGVICSEANKDDTLSIVSSDTGVGLKNARGLAVVMGGELVLIKNADHGCNACFSIPLMESEAAVVAQDIDRGYGRPERRLRVLVAEDDVINQMYLAGFLRLQGWDVDTAYNGLAVMELFEAGKYNLIILDGQMPGLNGFDTARQIRLSEPVDNRIPILAISGYAIPGDKQKFLDAGMDDYLPKPINEDELLRVINKLTR